MPLADLYMYAGIVGFLWIVGTAALSFANAGLDSSDPSNVDGGGGCGGDPGGGDTASGGDADGGSVDVSDVSTELTRTAQAGLTMPAKRINFVLLLLKLLSPSTIASFMFFFGCAGIILLRLAPAIGPASLLPAVVAGVIGYRLLSSLTSMMTRRMHVSSSYTHEQVIGLQAEITVPIPAKGLGEVTYAASGIRDTAPARALQPQQTFRKGQRVLLSDVRDGVFYVEPLPLEAQWGTVSDTTDKLQKD